MHYEIETTNWLALKLLNLLNYLKMVRVSPIKNEEYTQEEEIAENIVSAYKEMQQMRRKGEKGRDAYELLAELSNEQKE